MVVSDSVPWWNLRNCWPLGVICRMCLHQLSPQTAVEVWSCHQPVVGSANDVRGDPCPKDLATKALLLSPDFSVSGHPSLRPHRCSPLASDLSGMRPWSTFLVPVRSWPDRLREYTDNTKEA